MAYCPLDAVVIENNDSIDILSNSYLWDGPLLKTFSNIYPLNSLLFIISNYF